METKEETAISTPHIDQAMYLNGLGIALGRRFGSMEKLNAAVKAIEKAVESTPRDHPNRAMYLTNLSTSLRSRCEETKSIQDLNTAVKMSDEAVKLTPLDHSDRPLRLSSLGGALHGRFNCTGPMANLNAAIEANKEAVISIPGDDPVERYVCVFLAKSIPADKFIE